jgi:hypothetical protein
MEREHSRSVTNTSPQMDMKEKGMGEMQKEEEHYQLGEKEREQKRKHKKTMEENKKIKEATQSGVTP